MTYEGAAAFLPEYEPRGPKFAMAFLSGRRDEGYGRKWREQRSAQGVGFRPIEKEATVMRLKLALSTVAVICTAVAPTLIAAPAFAGDGYVRHYRIHHHRHYYRDYSGYMDPWSGHYDPEFQHNRENFGFSGRDPSRVGGEDPNLHPAPVGH